MGLIGALISAATDALVGVALGVAAAAQIGAALAVGGVVGATLGIIAWTIICFNCGADVENWNAFISNITFDVPTVSPYEILVDVKDASVYYSDYGNVTSKLTVKVTLAPIDASFTETIGSLVSSILTVAYKKLGYPPESIITQLAGGVNVSSISSGDVTATVKIPDSSTAIITIDRTNLFLFHDWLSIKIESLDPSVNIWDNNTWSSVASVKLMPWGYSAGALRINVVAIVKDVNTGAIKGYTIRRIQIPAVRITVDGNTFNCSHSGCGDLKPINFYMIPLKNIELDMTIYMDVPLAEGDIIEVYAGSPNMFYNIATLCCKSSSPPDMCKDFKLCNQICEAGFVTFPMLFEQYIKMFGYISPMTLQLAKVLADMSYPKSAKHALLSNEIKYYGSSDKVGVMLIDPQTLSPVTATISIKDGSISTSQQTSAITASASTNTVEISLSSKMRAIVNTPAPPAVSVGVNTFAGEDVFIDLDPFQILGSEVISGDPVSLPFGYSVVGSLAKQSYILLYIDDAHSAALISASGHLLLSFDPQTGAVDVGYDTDNGLAASAATTLKTILQQLVRYFRNGLAAGTVYSLNPIVNKAIYLIGSAIRENKKLENVKIGLD